MNENDFYQFKKSLEKERDLPFQKSDWLELKKRLESPPPKMVRHFPPGLKWVVAMALPLFFFFFLLLKQLQEKQALLETALQQLEVSRSLVKITPGKTQTAIISPDTLIVERVVYLPLSHNTLHPIGKKNNSIFLPAHLAQPPLFSSFFQKLIPGEKSNLNHPPIGQNKYLSDFEHSSFTTETNQLQKKLPLLSNRDPLRLPKINNAFSGLPMPVVPLAKKRFHRSLNNILPRSFGVELSGVSGQSLLTSREESFIWGTKLDLIAHFSNKWHLLVGIGYQSENFQLNAFQPESGVPPVASPAEGFVFDQAQVRQVAWQYHAGLRWQGFSDASWQPYLEIQYGHRFKLSSKAWYHFENDHEGFQFEGEEMVQNKTVSWAGAGIGLWYHPARTPWQLGLGGRYRQAFRAEQLQQWGLHAVLQYNF